jgi:anaerobic magnesium-protoporphyrin IX monomethyl ester cyclase
MRVLLINPPAMGRYWRPVTPHVGYGYLAEYLLVNHHQVKIADMRLGISYVALKEIIQKFKPNLIGFTSASLEYQKVYDLIEQIKKDYEIPVILGGPHASVVKEQVLQYSKVDLVVYGEGEKTLLEIANGRSYSKINGLIWRNKLGKIIVNPPRELNFHLDQIPFPKYQQFNMGQYLEHKIPLIGERGCPYACTFCASRLILGRGFRKRSPENIINEIKYWHKKGYREFGFYDDEFTGSKDWAEKICDLIIKNSLQSTFELRTGIRVDKADDRLIEKMKKAGFYFYAFGVESADPTVLQLVKKGVTNSQVKKAIMLVNKKGLEASAFFMVGLPGDTLKKFRSTLKFARSLNLNEVRFYNAVPYPGTEFFDWVLKYGWMLYPPEIYLNSFDRLQRDPVFETKEFPAEERRLAYDLGEQLFVELLFIKTVGQKFAQPLIFICKNNSLRHLIIKLGFRFTSIVRGIQKLRRGWIS